MQIKILFTALFLSSFVFAGTPVKVEVPVTDVYIPSGFDSNDSVEIIISGYLPNLCHKNPSTEFKVEKNTISIKATALKYHKTNPFCPEMIVPFLKSVKVGVLPKGNYNVVINKNEKDILKVEESTLTVKDNHIYAYVSYIDKSTLKDNHITIKAYNPSDCMSLDRVEVFDNGKNTYSILPIMKQNREFCPMKMVPYEFDVKLPKILKSRKVLLHVRSMDGNSVNAEVEL